MTERTRTTEQQADHIKFERLATVLADEVCGKINELAPKLDTPTMPYKAQYTLETLIQILQKRV